MPNNLKVAFVLPSLNGGGAERAVLLVARELSKLCNVSLVVVRNEGAYVSEVPDGIDVVLINEYGGRVQRILRLRRTVREHDWDVLVSALTPFSLWAAARLAQSKASLVMLAQNPVVEATRDVEVGPQAFPRYLIGIRALGFAYQRANAVIPCSLGVGAQLESAFRVQPHRIHVIANPIDADYIRCQAKRHGPLPCPLAPYIVNVGRLVPQKNHELFIDALASLRAVRDVRGLIIGDGPLRDRLEKYARDRGVDSACDIIPFQANPWAYMSRALAFVSTSHYEGFGNVMAEAMACGVPVIATRTDGALDIVKDGVNGLLADSNASDLTVKILSILSQPDGSAMIAAGLNTIEAMTPRTIARRYWDVLASTVSEHVSVRLKDSRAKRKRAADRTRDTLH